MLTDSSPFSVASCSFWALSNCLVEVYCAVGRLSSKNILSVYSRKESHQRVSTESFNECFSTILCSVGPLLVQCSGECRGAKAAKARYMRKVQRLKQAGKSPHRLDDWRNTSFECQCKSE